MNIAVASQGRSAFVPSYISAPSRRGTVTPMQASLNGGAGMVAPSLATSGFPIQPNPQAFFTPGRVFQTMFIQPFGCCGPQSPTSTSRGLPTIPHAKLRFFVVVRQSNDFCTAVPIMTYRGQGVGKLGIIKREHVIIYTGPYAPSPSARELPAHGEEGMQPQPLLVLPNTEQLLDRMSRLDLGKPKAIPYNWKVKDFGMVHQDWLSVLLAQFDRVFLS